MKKVFFLVLMIFIFISANSQHSFSEDFAIFEKEFSPYLSDAGEFRPKSHKMSKEFSVFWLSDSLTNQEKTNFIKSVKAIKAKSCVPYPSYAAFTDNLMNFCRKNVDRDQYDNYIKYLDDVLGSKKSKPSDVTKLILDVNKFISKNILAESNKSFWEIQNNSFLFKYEDGDLKLFLSHVDLAGFQTRDSLKIYNTSGEYSFKDNKWTGNGGTVYWEKYGYPKKNVYAKINDYSIKMNNLYYTTDSATFYNSFFYAKPIVGKLSDKAVNYDNPEKSSYPKFTSYQQHYKIPNILEGIDYEGGFSIQGKRFNLSGTENNLAKMQINKGDNAKLIAYSTSFFMTPENILSNNTEFKLFLENDSIYHPDVYFRYNIAEKRLELTRTKETDLSKVYFKNSYHKLKMDVSSLTWEIDKFKIDFSNIQASNKRSESFFESSDYYRLEKYESLKKRDMQHPLRVISNFVFEHWGSSEFKLEDLVAYMQYGPSQVLQIVLFLTHQGYMYYDASTHNIKVFPETWEFLEAHKGARDSDVIQIYSSTDLSKEANAELSLLNFDFKIKGVTDVHVSDSQNVIIYPIDKQLTVKRNRSFSFNGTVQAGQFYLYGSNFLFNYDEFIIDFPQCDSMKVTAESDIRDEKGNFKPAIVRSTLENLNGTFYIDAPGNKSGKGDYAEYPKLVSKDKSYVYFDDKNIAGGNYSRDVFYFEVDPFTKDSIEGYSRDNIQFKGTLFSGGIFPPIKESLVVRNLPVLLKNKEFYILCLGFKYKTGEKGLSLYDNKARFKHEIDLSNYGLLGKGQVDYLESRFNMDSILFLPNQMSGLSNKFYMSASTGSFNTPQSFGCNNLFSWKIDEDEFIVYSSKKEKIEDEIQYSPNNYRPHMKKEKLFTYSNTKDYCPDNNNNIFDMYANIEPLQYYSENKTLLREDKLRVYLDGDLKIKSSGLYGNGLLYIETDSSSALLKADDYVFENSHIKSEDTFFKIFSERNFLNAEIVNSKYVNTIIDFNEKKGFFNKNNFDDSYHFTQNLYECKANSAIWNMGEKDLSLRQETNKTNTDNKIEFISSHPSQDSLSFEAVTADYKFSTHRIEVMQVDSISVADAIIKLKDKDTLVIEKNAVIQPIKDASIIANTENRYHFIRNATTTIHGAHKYNAEGDYQYTYNTKDDSQTIHFSNISTDISGNSVGTAEIDISNNFLINPFFRFQGEIKFMGNTENLIYNGASKLISDCDTTDINENWLKIKGEIDPENIFIEIPAISYDQDNNKLGAGLVINSTYNNIYTTFFNKFKNSKDEILLTSEGYLHYQPDEGKFVIGSKEKIEDENAPGNILKIHKNLCNLYGQGLFNLSNNFGLFRPNAIGEFLLLNDKDSIDINISMLIEAPFNKEAYKSMTDSIKKTSGLAELNLNNDYYQQAVTEYLGIEKADEWKSNINKRNLNKIPKDLSSLFVLTDINLQWHKGLKSFIYVGPIGIANINKEHVNKYVWGILRIKKSKSGDSFELLLEPSEGSWYYFRYGENALNSISSNKTFNDLITKSKDKFSEDGKLFRTGLSSKNRRNTLKREVSKHIKLEYDAFDDYDDDDDEDYE